MSTPIQNNIVFANGLTFSGTLIGTDGSTAIFESLNVTGYGTYKGEEIATQEYANNLSILGENISINHLHDKITICPIAINFNKNKQIYFSEPYNSEGSAHNSIEKNAKKKLKFIRL